jgi:hypothetical protein
VRYWGGGHKLGKFAVLVAAFVLVLAPSSALAKKKHKKPKTLGPVVTVAATGPTVSTSGDFSVADATCPAGLQAVGGGFSAPYDGTTAAFVVTESYRSSPSTWRVRALDGDGVGAATAYAYCRRNNKVITDVTASATTASGFGQNAKAQALCSPGVAAISGGFQITSGPGATTAVPTESIGGGPTPGGIPSVGNWSVGAQNISSSETITAHVYCMAGIKLPAFQQVQNSATVGRLGSVTASANCPPAPKPKKKGKKKKKKKKPAQLLSAGAFYSPFPPGSSMVFPIHTESRIDGSGFIDRAINNGSGGTLTVQSQAMCF